MQSLSTTFIIALLLALSLSKATDAIPCSACFSQCFMPSNCDSSSIFYYSCTSRNGDRQRSCQTACFANCGQQGSPSSSSKVQNNYSSSSSTIYVKTIGGYSSSSSLSTVRYTPTYSSTTTTSSSSTTSIASSTSTFSPIAQASATSSSPSNSAPVVKPGLTLILLLSFICGVLACM